MSFSIMIDIDNADIITNYHISQSFGMILADAIKYDQAIDEYIRANIDDPSIIDGYHDKILPNQYKEALKRNINAAFIEYTVVDKSSNKQLNYTVMVMDNKLYYIILIQTFVFAVPSDDLRNLLIFNLINNEKRDNDA